MALKPMVGAGAAGGERSDVVRGGLSLYSRRYLPGAERL